MSFFENTERREHPSAFVLEVSANKAVPNASDRLSTFNVKQSILKKNFMGGAFATVLTLKHTIEKKNNCCIFVALLNLVPYIAAGL